MILILLNERSSLWQYHNWILQYDGQGGYVFTKLNPDHRLALQEEKIKLEFELIEIPKLENRLKDLKLIENDSENTHSPSAIGGIFQSIMHSLKVKRNKSVGQLYQQNEDIVRGGSSVRKFAN